MKFVVALGGNALGNSPEEQKQLVIHTAKSIVDLIEANHQVVFVHGNGPQVGMILKAFDVAYHAGQSVNMPMPEAGSMSQGYIGYHIQNAIYNEMSQRQLLKEVVTVVTQVEVDAKDPAFSHPTKPIGQFYSKEEAMTLAAEKGFTMVEDSGRGYRRVVASPKPIDIVEINTIRQLVDHGTVVIACGGGGVPVIRQENQYHGVDAVIDKDSSAALLARLLDADKFIILTAVSRVMIHFGKPHQKAIAKMNLEEAKRYVTEGHFAPGSMLPKVLASMDFVTNKPDSQALIASLEDVSEALQGATGTIIYHA